MNSSGLIRLFQNPHLIGERETEQLKSMLEDFPYSPILHLLYVRGLKNQKSYLLHDAVKKAALRLPDRRILFDWVEREDPNLEVPMKGSGSEETVATSVEEVTAKEPIVEEKVIEPKAEEVIPTPVEISEPEVVEAEQTESTETTQNAEPELSAETTGVEENEPTAEELEDIDESISESPVAKAPEFDPELVEEDEGPTSLDELDLNSLPERVRNIILKSRQVKQKFTPSQSEDRTEPEPVAEEEPQKTEIPMDSTEGDLKVEDERSATAAEEIPGADPDFDQEEAESHSRSQKPDDKESASPVMPPELQASKEDSQRPDARKSEVHSFSEWIHLKKQPETTEIDTPVEESPSPSPVPSEEGRTEAEGSLVPVTEKDQEKAGPAQKEDLVAKFIEKNPTFKPKRVEKETINMVELSYVDESAYVTETLAQIYVKQKHYDRAINAYEILRLKYPEKSSFFADRIESVKKLKHKK